MRFAILSAIILFNHCIAREPLSEKRVLEAVQKQPHFGILRRTGDFLFVDIDDAFLHQVAPLIQEEGFSEPPYFRDTLVGAHISVAFPEEIESIDEIQECGSEIFFIPKSCKIVEFHHANAFLPDAKELYLLVIEAPKLDQIREKYSLPKLRYDFHITIGVKNSTRLDFE